MLFNAICIIKICIGGYVLRKLLKSIAFLEIKCQKIKKLQKCCNKKKRNRCYEEMEIKKEKFNKRYN